MDISKLQSIIPDEVYQHLLDSIIQNTYEINTRLRMSHFVAQTMEESENYTRLSENLNYSADGLLKIFPSHFTQSDAQLYQHHPDKIANRAYGNRMGNGDEASGDGWKYRGSGYIMTTGKNNFTLESNKLKVDFVNNPDLLRTHQYALMSAGDFWYSNGINKIADLGTSTDTITLITKKINNGINGLQQRISNFQKVYALIS